MAIPDPPHVVELVDQPAGSAKLIVEVSDEFREWFKQDQNLQRWSTRRFEKWVLEALVHYAYIVKPQEGSDGGE